MYQYKKKNDASENVALNKLFRPDERVPRFIT